MNAQTPSLKSPEFFSAVVPEDVPDIVALGEGFYAESELSGLTPFSPDSFSRSLQFGLEGNILRGIMFRDAGLPAGFVLYTFDRSYTVDPLAYVWLLYVTPHLRGSPAGRLLLELAEQDCRAQGAVAFYGGAMAGIDGVNSTLPNLYRKRGFTPLFWGRKVLRKEHA